MGMWEMVWEGCMKGYQGNGRVDYIDIFRKGISTEEM